jgi:hypothetical protein
MCVRRALLGSSGFGSASATTVCPFSNRALAGMSPSALTGMPHSEWVATPTGTVGQVWNLFRVIYDGFRSDFVLC